MFEVSCHRARHRDAELAADGVAVGRKRISRLMRRAGILQPRAAARSHRQRDAGRHVPRSPARDPEPQIEDQTLDVGTKEKENLRNAA